MHPAPSVIIFTVLSGLGFGLMFFLCLGVIRPLGLDALLMWGLAYGLALAGLVASTFHLGRPMRALRAFTQWRSSWLSREAWASAATLLMAAPLALAAILGGALPAVFGIVTALLCLATVLATSMIYTQIRAVPRWNHWTTPAQFFGFALTGGAILSGQNAAVLPAAMLLVLPAALPTTIAVAAIHVTGAFAARWLFFAEAEHVVGLYYGQRQLAATS